MTAWESGSARGVLETYGSFSVVQRAGEAGASSPGGLELPKRGAIDS